MPRKKSNQQNNSSYQSVFSWISFFASIISLGIIIWNRPSVIPSNARNLLGNSPIIPAQAGTQASSSEFLDSRLHGNDNLVSTYQINFPTFTNSLLLSALAYHSTGNSMAAGLFASLSMQLPPLVSGQLSPLAASHEFRINTYTASDQVNARSATLNNGNIIVVWQSFNQTGEGWDIYGQLLTPMGSEISNEFQVNDYTVGDQVIPKVTALSNGGFAVIYIDLNRGTYAKVFNENATEIDAEFSISSDITTFGLGEPDSRDVAALDNDKFVVSWSTGGIPESIYVQQFNNSNTSLSSPFLVGSNNINRQLRPTIIKGEKNNFIIGWQELIGPTWRILIQAFNSTGGKIGNIIQCSPDDASYPTLTRLVNNNFVISLVEGRAGIGVTYRRIYNSSLLPLGDEIADIGAQAIVMPGNNDTYFVVRGFYTPNSDVYGQLYNLLSNPITQQFQINTYKESNRSFGVLYAGNLLHNGNIFVVWQSLNQTGEGWDIYGRILNITEILNPTKIAQMPTTASSVTSPSQLNSKPTSSSDPNLGAYIGGAAAGACAAGVLITAIGFFAASKYKKSQAKTKSNTNKVELQTVSTQQSSRNYGEIDATRKDSQQYDQPVKLNI
jgi:hypothetical protein